MLKKLILSSLLCYSTVLLAGTHWDTEQVEAYAHYSDLQHRSSWKLLAKQRFQGNEKILDIGCGDGKNSALLSNFVPNGYVFGIDPNLVMLDWAKKQYVKQEYPNLSFQAGDYNHTPTNHKFDMITGMFSFHLVPFKSRNVAIQNMYKQLNDNGRLILIIPPAPHSNKAFDEAIDKTINNTVWKPYFTKLTTNYYWEEFDILKQRFLDANFKEISINFRDSRDPFVGKQEMVNWIVSTLSFMQYVPKDKQQSLASQVVDTYVTINPDAKEDDVYYANWGRIEVTAKK